MIYKIMIMEKRHFYRTAGCLAMFIAVLAAVTSCRVPLDVDCPGTCGNHIYRGYHIQRHVRLRCHRRMDTMRSGLDAGGNRVLFTVEAEPNATGEERGFTVHLRYFTNEDSFTVRQESE